MSYSTLAVAPARADPADTASLASSTIASLGDIWSALHRDVEVVLTRRDVHCLRMAAMTMEDDLISQLLLRKMRQSRTVDHTHLPRETAAIWSAVDFTFGGRRRTVRLTHPSATASGVCVTSRHGAALVGLKSGQSILWPAECGRLRDLVVHAVAAAGTAMPAVDEREGRPPC